MRQPSPGPGAPPFPPEYEPPLDPPTMYRATRLDRVGDWLSAAGAIVFAGFITWAAVTAPRVLGIEWLFVGVLSILMLVFATYRVLHSMKADRILVTADGFVRFDVFGERRVAWKDVVGVTYTSTAGGGRTVILVHAAQGTDKVYLNLNLDSLAPPSREFVRQLYHFAPAALDYQPPIVRFFRWLGLKARTPKIALPPRAARTGEPPDFDAMRAKARVAMTGQDLEDLLQSIDQLERAMTGPLDPSRPQPGTKP